MIVKRIQTRSADHYTYLCAGPAQEVPQKALRPFVRVYGLQAETVARAVRARWLQLVKH